MMKAIHNKGVEVSRIKAVVKDQGKSKWWKQFTTMPIMLSLLTLLSKTKVNQNDESNSQQEALAELQRSGCQRPR